MSVRALTWSFALPLKDMAAKAVLNALSDHADEHGCCWPSMERMARWAGCEEKTVRRALGRLVELELIERQPRAGRTDVYQLNIGAEYREPLPNSPPLPETTPPIEAETPPNEAQTPDFKAQTPTHRGTRTTKNHHNRQGTVNEQRHKLPPDWQPSVDDRNHASDKGLDPETSSAAFTDYFCEGRGRNEKRTAEGWSKRFRIWCNTDADRRPGGRGGPGIRPARPGGGSEAGAFARAADRVGRG